MLTDWLMVGITFVYVVATLRIMRANKDSTKAAQEQLAESKRQFSETERLKIMPYFDLTISSGSTGNSHQTFYALDKLEKEEVVHWTVVDYTMSFRNVGMGTARSFSYVYNNFDREEANSFSFASCLPGEEKLFSFDVLVPSEKPCYIPATFHIYYYDLLENKYKITIEFLFAVNSEGRVSLDKKQISNPIFHQTKANTSIKMKRQSHGKADRKRLKKIS